MITLVHPYFDNPMMFQHQQDHWNTIPHEILKEIEVIVTDDCSPNYPAINYVVPVRQFQMRLYRIKKNVRWNWIAAKNIGAHEAKGGWLLLTDMDHQIPAETIQFLINLIGAGRMDEMVFYTFDRRDAPDLTECKAHPNTYFMHKKLFWRVGGYDEEFSGYYGTDGYYRKRLIRVANGGHHLDGLYVLRYPREVIADAETTEFKRKTDFDKSKKRFMSRNLKHNKPVKALTFPYQRLL